jgi:hypothetical protein
VLTVLLPALLKFAQGCGLVVFSQASEAAAALETLHGRFVWPGARSPMIIVSDRVSSKGCAGLGASPGGTPDRPHLQLHLSVGSVTCTLARRHVGLPAAT